MRSPLGKLVELLGSGVTLLSAAVKLLGKLPVDPGKVDPVSGFGSASLLDGPGAVVVGIVGHGVRTSKANVRSPLTKPSVYFAFTNGTGMRSERLLIRFPKLSPLKKKSTETFWPVWNPQAGQLLLGLLAVLVGSRKVHGGLGTDPAP